MLNAIQRGDVTVVFRRWRRPTVRGGGRLRTPIGVLAIERVTEVEPANLTDEQARQAGHPSADALRADLARREGQTYQIDLRFAGPDERVARRRCDDLGKDELDAELARLRQLDERARGGPWTRGVLHAIATGPEVPAAELAASLNVKADAFKRRVRRLKELGLTVSCSTGYRLSPRGQQVYGHLKTEKAE